MELGTVISHIGEPEAIDAIRPHWAESVASLPDDPLHFLSPGQFTVAREWGGFGPDVDPLLCETADRITADPVLRQLAWHAHQLMFEHPDFNEFRSWPHLEGVLGDRAGAFYLLLSLAVVPRIRAVHRSRGVPEDVTRATCRDIVIGAKRYRAISDGRLGMEPRRRSEPTAVSNRPIWRSASAQTGAPTRARCGATTGRPNANQFSTITPRHTSSRTAKRCRKRARR